MRRHVVGVLRVAARVGVAAVQDGRKRNGVVVFVFSHFLLLDVVVVLHKPVEGHKLGLVPQAVHKLRHVVGRGVALAQEGGHHLRHTSHDGTVALRVEGAEELTYLQFHLLGLIVLHHGGLDLSLIHI